MSIPKAYLGKTLLVNGEEVAPVVTSLSFWNEVVSGKINDYRWITSLLRSHDVSFDMSGDTSAKERYQAMMEAAYGVSYCNFCKSAGAYRLEDGYLYCMCTLLDYQQDYKKIVDTYGSYWYRQNLEMTTSGIGDIKATQLLENAISRAGKWIAYPDKWLVLSGNVGTGKSHILNAIMTKLYPFSIYIVAGDFENNLREFLNDEDPSKIQTYLRALTTHPILIFDDLGMEYSSAWIQAKLDYVIEARSRGGIWWDRLTLVGTNLPMKDIKNATARDGISRTGSRLTDFSMVDWLPLTGADFRNRRR